MKTFPGWPLSLLLTGTVHAKTVSTGQIWNVVVAPFSSDFYLSLFDFQYFEFDKYFSRFLLLQYFISNILGLINISADFYFYSIWFPIFWVLKIFVQHRCSCQQLQASGWKRWPKLPYTLLLDCHRQPKDYKDCSTFHRRIIAHISVSVN